MRRACLLKTLLVMVAVGVAACSSQQSAEPPQPGSDAASRPMTAAEPPKTLPAPAAADLYGAPAPTSAQLRELYDISRDVAAVAAGDANAPGDLADDLARFAAPGVARSGVDAFSDAVAQSLGQKTLTQEQAIRLTTLLYVTMKTPGLAPDQRQSLARAWEQTLTDAKVSTSGISAVVQELDRMAAAGKS